MNRLTLAPTTILATLIVAAVIAWPSAGPIDPPELKPVAKTAPGPDQRPADWEWTKRTFPFGNFDRASWFETIESVRALRQLPRSENSSLVWEFAGPTNVQGRVVDVEFDPLHPDTVYAAAATGGVFKSVDGGFSWTPLFDEQAILTIGDIGINPLNPNTIYVGTGEANGGAYNYAGGGLYKSYDGGETWTFLGLQNTVSIGRVVVDPVDTQRVYLAAVGSYFAPNPERGIYRSTDGGANWSQSLFVSDSTGGIDIVLNPANPSELYAAMWERVRRPSSSHLFGPTSGLHRSTDGGDSWTELGPANGLPDPDAITIGRIGIALCDSFPDILYALYNDGFNYVGLYKTTDGGDNWTDADTDNEVSGGTAGFSWYFGQVRVDPTNPDIVYALDQQLMRSTNGGQTWSINAQFHVDFHALAFKPGDPTYVINGNDGGVDISQNGGLSWSEADGMPISQFYEIGLDYNNPQRLYGGTQDNSTPRTLTGALDDWDVLYGGDGFYVIVDPTDPNVIYAESQFGGLGKSTNGGSSFFNATNGINQNDRFNWSTPVVMDPDDNLTLYFGTHRIYRTTNGAGNWTAISPDLTTGTPRISTVTTIAVAPSNSDVIYVGTADGNIWVSDDYGGTWNEASGTLPFRWVTRVAVDPLNENIAYVTYSGLRWVDPQPHIFRTTNMGTSWSDISANLPDVPINAIAIDRVEPQIIYIGTDVGAFVSFNEGASWEIFGVGLPLVTVGDMKVHDVDHFLVAGTHGRSMYKVDLSSVVGVDDNPAVPARVKLDQNYPNPFNPGTTIRFEIQKAGALTLKIYNLLGEEVRTLVDSKKTAGAHAVYWDGKNNVGAPVSSGSYIYRLVAGNTVLNGKMLLIK